MAVQSMQDNGSVKGSLDLGDYVTIRTTDDRTNTITVEQYLSATISAYDGDIPPNERLANVLKMANRLPVNSVLLDVVNNRTKLWNESHPTASVAGAAQCSQGMTFVAAGERVANAFCVDNEGTQKVNGKYPTWQDAKDFCVAAGKFLLTYEQHRLAAKSTSSADVRNSDEWEWVLNSNGDDRKGQVGGFFRYDSLRHHYDEDLYLFNPDGRYSGIAFRCGDFPSPQGSLSGVKSFKPESQFLRKLRACSAGCRCRACLRGVQINHPGHSHLAKDRIS